MVERSHLNEYAPYTDIVSTDTLDVKQLSPDSKDESVTMIWLVAEAPNPGEFVNHWKFFFELPPKQQTVRFIHVNMTLDRRHNQNEVIGVLKARTVDYAAPDSGVHRLSFDMQLNATGGDLLRLLLERGRDKYLFTASGEGCRFWCQTVLRDLLEGRFILKKDVDQASTDLGFFIGSRRRSRRPIREGEFYQ
ncbi:hypothetical protein TWF679_006304 [Orbilia oligospora]|uniref:DUF7770 domain-containing protein n=2 Tax=Orbilia oligospora TaxID=2813651 RepID=A0A8H8VAH6_ORBOL|nr:hypothetical protein TWF679_006304 [Orbilia oligospora]